jgi:hypothetical protein
MRDCFPVHLAEWEASLILAGVRLRANVRSAPRWQRLLSILAAGRDMPFTAAPTRKKSIFLPAPAAPLMWPFGVQGQTAFVSRAEFAAARMGIQRDRSKFNNSIRCNIRILAHLLCFLPTTVCIKRALID